MHEQLDMKSLKLAACLRERGLACPACPGRWPPGLSVESQHAAEIAALARDGLRRRCGTSGGRAASVHEILRESIGADRQIACRASMLIERRLTETQHASFTAVGSEQRFGHFIAACAAYCEIR